MLQSLSPKQFPHAPDHRVYRSPRCLLMTMVLAASAWLSTGATAATVQDFDVIGRGTPYAPRQTDNPPGPHRLPGGPTGSGHFLRLASATPIPASPNSNTITFPSTDPPADLIIVDFDFRITPGNAVVPGTGRADGLGFALVHAEHFTTPTVVPQPPVFAVEEPNFLGSVGIGFDIYKNVDHASGYPDDIGEDAIRGPNRFSNSLSVHFDGRLITQVDATRVVDLAGGHWIHARIILRPGRGLSDVTVTLTPQDCAPVTLIRTLRLPGFTPYAGRVHFGARSGGETAHHDLDNIRVQFLEPTQSVVAFSSVAYTVEETTAAAVVTVTRAGNTTSPVQVPYTTANATAKAGADYTATAGMLTFAAGETRQSFRVPIRRDALTERDETFRVVLRQPTGGAVVGGPALATVKIFDAQSARAVGHWSPIQCWPIVATHMHLLPTGKVLLWDRLGTIRRWNPLTRQSTATALPDENVFCSGHAFLADGQLLVTGGHHRHGAPADDGIGLRTARVYNPFTNTWTALPRMNAGRWYPTNTALANGEMLVISGSVDTAFTKNPLPQVWQPTSGTWRNLSNARAQPENLDALGAELYPWMFLAPDGQVFKAGPDQTTWFLNPVGRGAWSQGPTSRFGLRAYGTAVMYAPGKILIVGGGDVPGSTTDATAAAEVLDLNLPNPTWRRVAPMRFARRHLHATLLPDGQVLVTGGTGAPGFNNEANPVRRAELWDPETWTTLPAMQVTRGYHSTALLLPDGRVLNAGGGQGAGATSAYNNAEIYAPAYLFQGARPTISTAPRIVTYDQPFVVRTPNAANIAQVTMIRLPSVTHAFDQNQRFLRLDFSRGADRLIVTAPAMSTLAPPGHYMLFILNRNGVPSIARIIAVAPAAPIADDPTADDPTLALAGEEGQ